MNRRAFLRTLGLASATAFTLSPLLDLAPTIEAPSVGVANIDMDQFFVLMKEFYIEPLREMFNNQTVLLRFLKEGN